MKKSILITNIIRAIFAFMILAFVFTKNEQLSLRLMIVSFLLLTICYITKTYVIYSINRLELKFFINYLLLFFYFLVLAF